ncbi:WXG superfamily protein probably secreted by type VII secretion system [Pseudogracilibacillus auburnensis]|uniref:WXG superfamily protein probably secreted by type VII secretion system n=1 Tax=Pseudogracilibacillus auburnensis TaxID=1494959 RepID=A0A2V3W7Q2_9BACI|nr:T7SS effector LXG polymorphic toxin [Pseudogracilibacillus auburnensis]PXW90142.1 WXG superfamily protein probably secreted by type VII secretion system [Pseudogracilibacillus auburnensis]
MNQKVDLAEIMALAEKIATTRDIVMNDLNTISKHINKFAAMESFTGDSATSVKNYLANVHQIIIASFQQLFIHLHESLERNMDHFQSNVDASESARISSWYLEGLKREFETIFTFLRGHAEESSNIIDSVSPLVYITNPSFSATDMSKETLHQTIHYLNINLDVFANQHIDPQTKELLHHINLLMNELKSRTGEARFVHTRTTSIISLKEMLFLDGGLFPSLLEKVAKDEVLNADEREMLYNFFQNIYLDKNMKEEIEDIATFITGENIDKLKERLNAKVVITKDTLEEEMTNIQAYLYLGNARPSQSYLNNDTRAKLKTYLILLHHYYTTMENNIIVTVDKLEYKKNREDIPSHYLFSALQTAKYNIDEDVMDKQRFREWVFDSENYTVNNYSLSEITYYVGTDAASDRINQPLNEIKDQQATYTSDFLTKKFIGNVFSKVMSTLKAGDAVDIVKSASEYGSVKSELDQKIAVEKILLASSRLNLEFTLSKSHSVPSAGETLDMQLYPTDKTYEMIERWKEVFSSNREIPYLNKLIQTDDWFKIADYLEKIKLKYGSDLTNYIQDGILKDGTMVDDLVKEAD